jgi:hypothetical protein
MYSSPVRRFTSVLLHLLARLACIRRAASVRSEPGSNSHKDSLELNPRVTSSIHLTHFSLYSVFKELKLRNKIPRPRPGDVLESLDRAVDLLTVLLFGQAHYPRKGEYSLPIKVPLVAA